MAPKVSLVLMVLLAVSCARSTPWRTSAGKELSDRCAADAGTVLLSSLTHAPATWDRVVLIGPYEDAAAVQRELGFAWNSAERFNLASRDDAHLALFVRGGDVVQIEEWARGEFAPPPVWLTKRSLLPTAVVPCD